MIPVYEYDAAAAAHHEIQFVRSVQNVEKYVLGFKALNNRITTRNENYKGDEYKYEKVCLLLVDFSKKQPLVYTKTDDLKRDGLLPQSSPATIENLIFTNFVPHLLHTYTDRFDDR
ncbi:MAG: hypothetical protein MUF71_12290 [Candidatus Kapabacteria bacterium]|nr:hypothetical protein [Candidatus Kapabacteria bacterium]